MSYQCGIGGRLAQMMWGDGDTHESPEDYQSEPAPQLRGAYR